MRVLAVEPWVVMLNFNYLKPGISGSEGELHTTIFLVKYPYAESVIDDATW